MASLFVYIRRKRNKKAAITYGIGNNCVYLPAKS